MKKIGLFLIFLILFSSFFVLVSSLNINNSSVNKIDSKILDSLTKSNKVRVIINLNQVQSKNSNSFSVQNINGLINSSDIKHNFGNYISALVSNDEINNLENSSLVKSIVLEGTKHIILQTSVPLINATSSWNLNPVNINLTGTGQTVCIIDTGVNYSHHDLGGCYGNNDASSNCKVIGGYDFVNNDADPMDDNGHGTHVSGIVAANGNIKGVAPDAKIIMIKVCDSSGSCYDGDILSGIYWCINNASKYNISVISISLGSNVDYNTYCDTNSSDPSNSLFSQAINSAVANNISVVVASGNDGADNMISSPACIQNATPVGAVYDGNFGSLSWGSPLTCTDSSTFADKIACFSNRYSLMSIFAPGALINSTSISGGYVQEGGTSMATPHVAGAMAIINQYLKLSNQTKNPKQIESTLNQTGKKIIDSSTHVNYSRIDLYSALIALDTQVPNVSLITPNNNSIINYNQTFNCNASDLDLKNITFYLWNSSGIFNQTSLNISGSTNNFQINISNIPIDSYQWNCLYYDQNNNSAFATTNNTFRTGIFTKLNSPENNSAVNTSQQFNCSVDSSIPIKNLTFNLWNLNGLNYSNTTNITGTSNSSLFTYNFSVQDNYQWNCLAFNNNSESSYANYNNSIIYDITPPNVSSVAPFPSDEQSSSVSKTFLYNVSDNLEINNCSLIVNNTILQTNSSITNQSINQSFIQTFTPGVYNWSINCSDYGNNVANSSIQTFTITSPPVVSHSSGGGGGGGGGGGQSYQTINLNESDFQSGITKTLGVKDKIIFNNHSLTINQINANSINITLRSDPTNASLYIGEEIKFNLTNSFYYDLYIKLENISNNKVNITIKEINESILVSNEGYKKIQLDQNNTNRIIGINEVSNNLFNMNKYTLIGVTLCLISGIIYLISRFISFLGRKSTHHKKIK